MFYIIENYEQLKEFYYKEIEEAFVEIIPFNDHIHPTINNVSLIYIRPIDDNKGYILCVEHNDTLQLSINAISTVINKINKIYVRDKKEFLHYLIHPNIVDITLEHIYERPTTSAHDYFYRNYQHVDDLNKIIPISKHYEVCEKIFNDLKEKINEPINLFYNDRASLVFNAIERNGLRIQREKFKDHFYNVDADYIYSQYNFKTTTRRPANRFGGVNYAALNKENGSREVFIPRNDKLVEIDLSAFHPTLISKLMDYDFGDKNIYHEIVEECNVSYDEAKKIVLKNLNGNIFEEYTNVEFFSRLQHFKDKLWEQFQNEGFIEDKTSEWKFHKDKLENMNPNKLLNYLLQTTETSTNINIIWDMLKILRGKNTKLILFTYDAFLLDLDDDEEDLIDKILEIFKTYKFDVKIKTGYNYNNLK
jgi:hypothetical protein